MNPSTIISALFKFAFKGVKYFINKAAWVGYFVVSCETVSDVDINDAKDIANETYKKSSVKVIPLIKEMLENKGYEPSLINTYLSTFIEKIKDSNPLLFVTFEIDNIRQRLSIIEEKQELIDLTMELLKSDPSFNLHYFSIDEYDNYLQQAAKNDYKNKVCLDLFDFNDVNFDKEINEQISDNNQIIISGEYQKETLLATLCVLRRIFPLDYAEKVFIFHNKSDYMMALETQLPENSILINSFFEDDIPTISKYINIHIVSKWKTKQSTIRLKPRLLKSTRSSFERNNYSHEEISKLLIKCKNSFPHIYRELVNETDEFEIKVREKIEKKVYLSSLLVNSFSLSSPKDTAFVEKLSGYDISDFVDKLIPPALSETPFAKRSQKFDGEIVTVLDFERSFDSFSDDISLSLINKFFNMAKEALCELPLAYSSDNYLKTMGENSYSPSFISSIFETLLYLKARNRYKSQCDAFVETFVGWINNSNDIKHYKYLADYLHLLVEINPAFVGNTLMNSVSDVEVSGVCSLFHKENRNDDVFTGSSKYIKVLWTFEKLLFFNSQRENAVLTLFNLYRVTSNYATSNSPKNSLKTFFTAWMNTTPASIEEKNKLADALFAIDKEKAWYIFVDLLFSFSSDFVCPFGGLEYIKPDGVTKPCTRPQVFETYKHYNDLIIENASTCDQLAKIVDEQSFVHFGNESIDKVIKKITKYCKEHSDDERETISMQIRSFIHKNRKYANSDWAIGENIIQLFEELLKKIKYVNREIQFIYLFERYDIEEPNPVVYLEGQMDYEASEANKAAYIDSKYKEFIRRHLSIDYLYNYFEQKASENNLTRRFYNFSKKYEMEHNHYSFIEFADNIIGKMPHVSIFYSYLASDSLENFKQDYRYIFDQLVDKKMSIPLLEFFYVCKIDLNNPEWNELYNALPKDTEEEYWKRLRRFTEIEIADKNTVEFVLSKLRNVPPKESENKPFLSILYEYLINSKDPEKFDITLKLISESKPDFIVEGDINYLIQILSVLQDNYLTTDDIEIMTKIAMIELLVIRRDNGKSSVFLKELLSRDPNLYYFFVSGMYDSNSNMSKEQKENFFYLLNFSLKFCPGYIRGVFDPQLFTNWVTVFEQKIMELDFEDKERLLFSTLGKLFKHSHGAGDLPMPEEIINYIESISEAKNYEKLKISFVNEDVNSLGVRNINDGRDLLDRANKFNEIAEALEQKEYPKTAEIYRCLFEDYKAQAELERKQAEDD